MTSGDSGGAGAGDMTPPEPMNDSAPEIERHAPASTVRPGLVVRCRADGALTFANDNYCRMIGCTRAQLDSHNFWSFLPAKERRRGRRHVRSLTPDEPAAVIEYVLDAPPGHIRRQQWIDHARFDEAGQLVEWMAYGEDRVTESPNWLAEASLQAAILAALPDLFILFSPRGDYLSFHAPRSASAATPPADFIGRNIRDVMPPATADSLQAMFDRTLASGEVTTLEYQLEEAGEERVLEARIARCSPGLLLALIRDRTAERLTASALDRAEAQARDLQQEIALLGQVASLGVLAGSLAHELNQPLMSTATNAQAALRFLSAPAPNLDEARAALTDIGHSNRRVGDIVRGLLDKLRRRATVHVPLDVNPLVANVVRMVRRQPRARRVAIESQLGANLPLIAGDRILLEQVILNLLLNACDAVEAVESGSRRVVVRTEREDEGVLVSVVDWGIGIPVADLGRVFEPFFTTKSHGTGLGLPISRTILTLHGTRLTTARNPERGMTFSFKLAVAPARHGKASSNDA
jgi:signal transduction histidine kinase